MYRRPSSSVDAIQKIEKACEDMRCEADSNTTTWKNFWLGVDAILSYELKDHIENWSRQNVIVQVILNVITPSLEEKLREPVTFDRCTMAAMNYPDEYVRKIQKISEFFDALLRCTKYCKKRTDVDDDLKLSATVLYKTFSDDLCKEPLKLLYVTDRKVEMLIDFFNSRLNHIFIESTDIKLNALPFEMLVF